MTPEQNIFGFIDEKRVRSALVSSEGRIRRAYAELFSGYDLSAESVLNETVQVEAYEGLVTVDKITFYTFCEHHFLPFFGQAEVTYRPNRIITGIGKLIRLVRDVHARRLQIQEIMARDICEDVMRVLEAKGARVTLRARHLCTCSRGPRDDNSETEVVYELGEI
jgi:GTP cyclohydrolase I